MTKRRWLMVALGAAAVLLILGRVLASVYADYLWYESLGAVALWRVQMGALAAMRAGMAVIAGSLAFANLYAVRRSVVSLVFPRRLGNLEIGEEVPSRYLMGATVTLSVVLGLLLALPESDWTTLVFARSGRPFNEADPYIGADLGFYVYWLPFENHLWTWTFFAVMVVLITVVLLYALTPSLKWQRGSVYASAYVRRHLTVLVGVLLLMLAWSFRLDMHALLIDGSGVDGAFSYADYRVGIPGNLILSLTTLAAALIVMWSGYAGHLRLAGISVISVIALSVIVREIAPVVVEHIGTDARRAAREQPYLATRATYTRRAFDVGAVTPADSSIAFATLADALPWTPFWDPPALSRALHVARGDDDQGVLVSWRPSAAGLVADVIDPPPTGVSARTPWTVNRLIAASADDRGLPIHEVSADAPVVDDIVLDPPLIYPGAPQISILPDSLSRTAGTSLESFAARLANAWSLQNLSILSSDLPYPRPTIVAHRDVRERVELLAPFFAQGRSVQPVLLGDSLYWSLDLYAASDMYPLSRHALIAGEDRSYLRHAAVAVVHASTGDIVIVPDSTLDPIASTWTRRLPSLFGTWNALPAGIRPLLAPPIDGLYAQATAFGRYGSGTDNDPARHTPVYTGADPALLTDDIPIALPRNRVAAFALPLLDPTERLRGLLIGTGGGGGATRTMWYPLAAPGPRWNAILDRLRGLDTAGGALREGPLAHGRVRALPIRGGIGFLQPTYRWRGQTTPTLNRVAILTGDSARSIVPSAAVVPRLPESVSVGTDLKASVAALYATMREALRRGDWTTFGRAFDELGRVLSQPRAR